MRRLRVAIIGGGFGVQVHAPAWAGLPGVEVVAVADAGSGRAARGGLPYVGEWRSAIAAGDLVVVAVPPAAQHAVVLACLAAGRDVLCEKPCGIDACQSAELMAAATGRLVAVGFQYRYHPGILAVRQALADGRLGRIRGVTAEWMTGARAGAARPWGWQHDAAAGGGVVGSHASHLIDLLAWLGVPAERVVAAERRVHVPTRLRDGVACPVSAEEEVAALLAHGDGAMSTLRAGNCQPGGGGLRLTVHGDAGTAAFAWRHPFRHANLSVTCWIGDGEPIDLRPSGDAPAGDERIAGVRSLAERIVAALHGRPTDPIPTIADAHRVNLLLDQMRAGPCLPFPSLRPPTP